MLFCHRKRYLIKSLRESKKKYSTKCLLKMFLDKMWGVMQEKCVRKEDSRCWWVVRMHGWTLSLTLPSDSGAVMKARETFRAQTVRAQTVNKCCLLDCAELSICGSKTWMTTVCTSVHVCHVMIHHLHCCTVQQLSLSVYVSLIYNCKVTVVVYFIRIGLGVFKIICETEGVFFWTQCICRSVIMCSHLYWCFSWAFKHLSPKIHSHISAVGKWIHKVFPLCADV